MKKRQLGCSDLEITPVVLGTWALGGWLWGGTRKNQPEAAIHAALDEGINLVDTAPVYGFGLSEEVVGRAIKGRRRAVYLATKCGMVWDDRPGGEAFFDTTTGEGRAVSIRRNLTKASILKECDESLRRLQTDVIDLYQCHWPDPSTPMEETMEALEILREQGKIRWYGVSNFDADLLSEAVNVGDPVSLQPKYSLLSREIEKDALPCCQDLGLGVLCYSPMEMGLLTGKIGMDHEFPESDTRKHRPWFQKDKRREVLQALDDVKPLAEEAGLTLAQTAVAWVHSQPGVTAAIVGARNPEQARMNARAARPLQPEALKALRARFSTLTLDEPFDPANAQR